MSLQSLQDSRVAENHRCRATDRSYLGPEEAAKLEPDTVTKETLQMSPTPEASARQRKAAFKAWNTIRRKKAEGGQKPEEKPNSAKARASSDRLPSRQRTIKKLKVTNYPTDWKEIVAEIRSRSRNTDGREQCECQGECLKHQGRCEEINGTWAQYRRRAGNIKIRFTIAHLCHTTICDERSHLKAMCEPCHLIYDLRCRQSRIRPAKTH